MCLFHVSLAAAAAVVILSIAFLLSKRKQAKSLRISALYYYPIKSCGPISVSSLEFDRLGPVLDRRWLVVDEKNNFVTARQQPKMVLIKPSIRDRDGLKAGAAVTPQSVTLVVDAPDMPQLVVGKPEKDIEMATVWSAAQRALVYRSEVNDWFSKYLGIPVRLVCTHDEQRPIKAGFDTMPHDPNMGIAFHDAFPTLAISESSLSALSKQCPEPIEMFNFRPNIVISGSKPYEEDTWKRVRIGGFVFNGEKACDRCIFTTVNPKTGQKSRVGEPLITMRQYRGVNPVTGAGDEGKCYFGMHFVHAAIASRIAVGDRIEPLELHPPVKNAASNKKQD